MKVVFDLDNTLADCSARVKKYLLDAHGKKKRFNDTDWDSFYLACDHDEPIVPNIAVCHALIEYGHDVQIWTGRSDIARDKTEDWLTFHGIPPSIAASMLMRPAGDYTHDDKLKIGWGHLHGMPDLVFEDRDRVVKAWRHIGVTCHQVQEGNF